MGWGGGSAGTSGGIALTSTDACAAHPWRALSHPRDPVETAEELATVVAAVVADLGEVRQLCRSDGSAVMLLLVGPNV